MTSTKCIKGENSPPWLVLTSSGFRGSQSGDNYRPERPPEALNAHNLALEAAKVERIAIRDAARELARAERAKASAIQRELDRALRHCRSQRLKAEQAARKALRLSPEEIHRIRVEAGNKACATRAARRVAAGLPPVPATHSQCPPGRMSLLAASVAAPCSPGTASKGLHSGEIPCERIGGINYVRVEDVRAYAEKRRAMKTERNRASIHIAAAASLKARKAHWADDPDRPRLIKRKARA